MRVCVALAGVLACAQDAEREAARKAWQGENAKGVRLSNAGRYPDAQASFERALPLAERGFGKESPEVGATLFNLARVYRTLGQPAKALPLARRAAAVTERALGADHPDTAACLNELGVLHLGLGQPAQALPLFRRALAAREKVLGKDHPDTAQSLNNLAALYR